MQRRQNVVMDSAARSNAIVSNLYPATFRDQLMKEAISERKSSGVEMGWNPLRGVGLHRSDSGTSSEDTGPLTSEKIFGCKPLAELYPERCVERCLLQLGMIQSTLSYQIWHSSTIMFADLAGFTSWSSEREPQQVFALLESIYYAFDQIAKRRRVFKGMKVTPPINH
jgi:Adenylate and Guanylate cyclase catalytic domain